MVSLGTFTASVPKKVLETEDFEDWVESLEGIDLRKVELTLETLHDDGVIASVKGLGRGLYEKKWPSGLRMYFAVANLEGIGHCLLLLGSGKGLSQDRAIKKCYAIMHGYQIFTGSILKR